AKPPTNWSRKEGIQLCHLSINISVDSVHGYPGEIIHWFAVALGRNPSFGVEFLQYFKQIENLTIISLSRLTSCMLQWSASHLNCATAGQFCATKSKPKPVAASTPVRRHVVGNSGEEEEGGEEEARTIGRKRTKKVVQEKSKAAKLFEMFQERNKLEDGQVHDYMEML
ncbi:hypothetical protein CU098_013208, partial [Rhizopus stolonifer]